MMSALLLRPAAADPLPAAKPESVGRSSTRLPGPVRRHCRELVKTLIVQAIAD